MIRPPRRMAVISAMCLSLMLTFGAAAPVGAATVIKVLYVPQTYQQQTNWCWAASNQAVIRYIHGGVVFQQCDQANAAGGLTQCCDYPSRSNCNVGRYNADVVRIDRARGYSATEYSGVLSFGSVTSYINAGRPFIVAEQGQAAPGGASYGHDVVVYGYDYVSGTNGTGDQWLYVMDPARGLQTWSYADLKKDPYSSQVWNGGGVY